MCLQNPTRAPAGFTLIELMVVCVIVVAFITYAMPAMTGVLQRSALDQAQQDVTDTLALAQAHAKRLNKDVYVCAGDQAQACGGGDWTKGWSLFHVKRTQGAQALKLIRYFPPVSMNVEVEVGQNTIRVTKHGALQGNQLTVDLCHEALDEYWSQVDFNGFSVKKIDHHYSGVSSNCSG